MKIKPLLLVSLFFVSVSVNAAEHHSGHGGGTGGASGGTGCIKAHLSKFTPPHLSKIAPESEFSFVAQNIHSPDQIRLTVKGTPVEFDAEFKDPFYLIKAKLPAGLKATMARVNIKVSAKSSSCEAENGWLLDIGE
jgi:hypothetical protein